jgi:prevent-host-death family protein
VERISFAQDIQPLSSFRSNVAGFIKQVQSTHRPLVITSHGRSSAVLLDVNNYEALMERLDLLQDVHTAELQLAAGEGMPHDEALEKVLSLVAR